MPKASMNHRVPTVDDLRVKLCYICREEEKYDSNPEESTRAWTHPCKCTLIAHESCLLKWIQTSQGSSSRAPNALKCPQCGFNYELESKDSIVLHLLSSGNRSLQRMGRLFTAVSAASIVGVVGAGVYIILTSYGAWAVHQFIGKEMFDILLTDDPTHWPWNAYFNLPLLPISLILSRMGGSSQIPPIIPILLVWPPSYPVGERNRLLNEYWLQPDNARNLSLMAPARSWPPSPVAFGLFFFPFIRVFYRRLYDRVYFQVLGTRPVVPRAGRGLGLHINEGAFMIRIRANVDDGGVPEGPAEEEQAQNIPNGPPDPNQDPDAAAVAAAEQLIEINTMSLGRRIGGALLIPAISSFMGSILLRLSRHSGLLRNFLGIKHPLSSRTFLPPPLGPFSYEKPWRSLSVMKQISVALRLTVASLWGGTRTWAESDPVWWRNTIGLGLFVVAKDCIQLLHLWLAKRELESRRVKNRDFEGVDIRELDLKPTYPQYEGRG